MSAPNTASHRVGISMAIATIVALSAVINLLSLGGAIYMLQVYDRVFASQSVPTLVVLTVLLAIAYVSLGLLDALRAQLVLRIGDRIDTRMAEGAFGAFFANRPSGVRGAADNRPLRDVEAVRAFLLGAAPIAMIDLPWVPLFLVFVALLEPTLGWVTLVCLLLMAVFSHLAQSAAHRFERESADTIRHRREIADAAAGGSDVVRAMGLGHALAERRHLKEIVSSRSLRRAGDRVAWLNSLVRVMRLSVHAALIGIGGYVALKGDVGMGAIIAASIAAGRALAPVELAVAHWQTIRNARAAWLRLRSMPAPIAAPATPSTASDAGLSIHGLICVLPGQSRPLLRGISFELQPGSAIVVLGTSGSGKTILCQALVGLIFPTVGSVKMTGIPIAQMRDIERRASIAYAPQREQWLPGDITDTITGLGTGNVRAGAIETAQAAGIHRAISELPRGYATPIEEALGVLSHGQRRQLALARAFHGQARLIVLDEPFADLDLKGEEALIRMIASARRRGAIVIVTSKRRLARSGIENVAVIDSGSLKLAVASDSRLASDDKCAPDHSAGVVALPRRMS